MELVTGIERGPGGLVAVGSGANGRKVCLAPGEIATRGLPNAEGNPRRIRTNLREWHTTSLDEYAYAFRRPMTGAANHSTWWFREGSSRLVVPALALLRAMVRPSAVLFPHLLKPQSLDDVCIFDKSKSGLCRPQLFRLGDRYRGPQEILMGPLSWFYCFPSARRAWASVYQNAVAGRLDFELPNVVATFSVRTVRAGCNAYVTAMTLLELEPQEEPLPFAVSHPRILSVSPASMGGVAKAAKAAKAVKAAKSKPEAEPTEAHQPVSDSEWGVLGRIVYPPRTRGVSARQAREMFNCVLQKTVTNIEWAQAAAENGVNPSTAAVALSRWRADGRWEQAMRLLAESRGHTMPRP